MSAISTERAHFYPRPPRGGRPRTDKRMFNVTANFYPRPPRGGRQFANLGEQPVKKFLSTPSARRATLRQAFAVQHYYISIHALREEGDRLADFCFCLCTDFYPRPPRGGRHKLDCFLKVFHPFLSTPSARRATYGLARARNDHKHFYPRPPRGGRQSTNAATRSRFKFLSTPSARRATGFCLIAHRPIRISIHALREEGDNAGSRKPCRDG